MEFITSDVIILAACVVLGFAAHVIKRIIQYRMSDPSFSFYSYMKVYPYHLTYNTILTVAMTLVCYQIDQLNGVTAFFSGFASNSVVSIIRARLDYASQNSGTNKGKDANNPSTDI